MSEELVKLSELSLFSKININRFFEKFLLNINQLIKISALIQKILIKSNHGLNLQYKVA